MEGDRPVTGGTALSLRIFLPSAPNPIQIDSATVQGAKGREFELSMATIPELSLSAIKSFLDGALEAPAEPAPDKDPFENP